MLAHPQLAAPWSPTMISSFPKVRTPGTTLHFLLAASSARAPKGTSSLHVGPPLPGLHPPLLISVLPSGNLWETVGSHGPDCRSRAKKPRQALPLPSRKNHFFPFLSSSREHSRLGGIKYKSNSQWEPRAHNLSPGLRDDQGQGSLIYSSRFNKGSEWKSHGVPINRARIASSLLS